MRRTLPFYRANPKTDATGSKAAIPQERTNGSFVHTAVLGLPIMQHDAMEDWFGEAAPQRRSAPCAAALGRDYSLSAAQISGGKVYAWRAATLQMSSLIISICN